MTAEELRRLNTKHEDVYVIFEDGLKFAVTRSLFDEQPEECWVTVNRLHDQQLARKSQVSNDSK